MNHLHQTQASPSAVRGGMTELRETFKIVLWGLLLLAVVVLLRDVRVWPAADFPSRTLAPAELAPPEPGEGTAVPRP